MCELSEGKKSREVTTINQHNWEKNLRQFVKIEDRGVQHGLLRAKNQGHQTSLKDIKVKLNSTYESMGRMQKEIQEEP
jgi:hypothetical protein